MPDSPHFPLDAELAIVGEPVFTDIPGETVILDTRSGSYFSLDDVGSFVWRHLQTPTTLRALLVQVTQDYDVDAAVCERDLRALLTDLQAAELITIGGPSSG